MRSNAERSGGQAGLFEVAAVRREAVTKWRRDRDSNPGWGINPLTLSRRVL
jgi:hypothetical protein